jgi:hypothetical protein
MGIENGNGHYVILPQCDASRCDFVQPELQLNHQKKWNRIWWWIKAAVLCLFLIGACAVLLIFGGPLVINKVTFFLHTSFCLDSDFTIKKNSSLYRFYER